MTIINMHSSCGAKDFDMLLKLNRVSVGNSQSKLIVNGSKEWVYTPRGYSKKL